MIRFALVSVTRRWSSAGELGIELFDGVQVVQRIEKKYIACRGEVEACQVCSFEFHVSLCFFLTMVSNGIDTM